MQVIGKTSNCSVFGSIRMGSCAQIGHREHQPGLASWLVCGVRPVLKMLNEVCKLKVKHKAAAVPQNCKLYTHVLLGPPELHDDKHESSQSSEEIPGAEQTLKKCNLFLMFFFIQSKRRKA